MAKKDEEFRKLLTQWNDTILAPWHQELAEKLDEVELSALYSCIPDCFESFYEVYYELLPALVRTQPNDFEKLFDYTHDIGGIGGSLEHIKSHITDARKGFDVLIKLMEQKAQRNE